MRLRSNEGNGGYHAQISEQEFHVDTQSRSNLTVKERKEYTDAVLCLMSKPALTAAQAPGAKSRFDDYGKSSLDCPRKGIADGCLALSGCPHSTNPQKPRLSK